MKLLTYSSRRFLTYTTVLLLLSIPLFYVLLNALFTHSVDNTLKKHAALFPEYSQYIKNEQDLSLWKDLDWDIEIMEADAMPFQKAPYTKSELSKENGQMEHYRELQQKSTILGKEYLVIFKSSLIEKEDLIKAVLLFQVILLILLLLGIYLINRRINKKTWLPFQNILNYIRNFDLEKSPIKETETLKITEFNELNQSLNDLLLRAKGTFIAQKEFTENASHELQTPLAVLKSKLEVFLQQDTLSEKQSHLIDDMNGVISNLEQLNKSLLLLTKMDNLEYPLHDKLGIESLVLQIKNDLSFITDFTQHTVQVNTEQDFLLNGNPLLFKHLISNLFTNALHYSPKGSTLDICIDRHSFSISNTGVPFNFQDEKLFHRFSKKHSLKSGNGLGLAISYKIANLHGLKLTHKYQNGKHTFTVHI